ncbi:unnamed protein product [Amoebophrya sp. A25]|nr:unnamed protein product [Amoebophrya sp. A25]|eukprot:GSA25T00002587001.1
MGIHRTIASSFVMAIGDQTTERNYKIGGKATPAFTALSIARRDSPHLDASVFRQNAKDDYATGVDGLTGSPKPDSYFTLTQDVVAADVGCDAEDDESVQLFEGDVAACIKDRVMRDLLSEAPAGPEKEKKDASGNALPLTPEQEEANRKAKGAYFNFVKSIVGKQQASGWVKIIDEKIAENRLSPEDAAKEAEDINSMHEAHVERKKLVEAKKEREARLAHYQKVLGAMKEVDAKVAGNDNAEMKMNIFKTFAFGKAAYYTRADKTLRMAITRDSTLTVSKLVEGDANQVISLSKKITEKLVYDFEGCDAALDFKEDSFVAKDTKCKLVKADILPAGKVVTTFAGASPKPDADPEEAAAKKKQSGKEAKNKWLAKPLEERKASVESAWVPFWKKESKAVAASESFFFSKLHFGEKKDLLGENRDTKFKLQVHKAHELMSDRIGSEQAAVEVHTYPGEVAAGVNGGCTLEMCNLSEDQWEQSFGFYGTWVGGSRSWRKVKPYFDMDADPAKAAEYLAKPFAFAELHGYTMSPVPGGFISMAFFLGILLNAGQSWMSAYIAKVLSSLWKNICAAIALVVVVLVEKTFLDDTIKKAETDWTRVVFGMCGVIFTVLVFQMSPKEKKH